MNYKGGVGKTTLTANLGAELAARGRTVLLLDLDPQASLTFSFYSSDHWERNLSGHRTIKQWYETAGARGATRLSELISTPPTVNARLAGCGGRLDLVPSHLELINIDLELAAELGGGGTMEEQRDTFLEIHCRLADGLADPDLAAYDLILIDCAPNFNVTTKTAIVASDRILVPARPDFLSTLGISYLLRKTRELADDYNRWIQPGRGPDDDYPLMAAPDLAVVFTMVQFYTGQPIRAQRPAMEEVRRLGIRTFDNQVRENNSLFAEAAGRGIPAVLQENANREIMTELAQLVDEFEAWGIGIPLEGSGAR